MWAYRLALALGNSLALHERVVIGEETDPKLRRLVAHRFYRQGLSLQSRGRLGDALEILQRGSFVDPEYGALHSAVGAIFQLMERNLEAVPWLERAVELEPSNAAWRVELAASFEATGRPDAALYHYRAARGLNPVLEAAHEGAVRLEAWLDDHTRAERQRPWWMAGTNV